MVELMDGRLTVEAAAMLMCLGRRQVLRLLRGLRHDGASSLISRRRGRPSNHRLPQAVRELALTLVRERYRDFGPTLATEKLAAVHGRTVSHETLRQWMIADGLLTDRRHRQPASATSPARMSRRTGADRRLRAHLVRGPVSSCRLEGSGSNLVIFSLAERTHPRTEQRDASPPVLRA